MHGRSATCAAVVAALALVPAGAEASTPARTVVVDGVGHPVRSRAEYRRLHVHYFAMLHRGRTYGFHTRRAFRRFLVGHQHLRLARRSLLAARNNPAHAASADCSDDLYRDIDYANWLSWVPPRAHYAALGDQIDREVSSIHAGTAMTLYVDSKFSGDHVYLEAGNYADLRQIMLPFSWKDWNDSIRSAITYNCPDRPVPAPPFLAPSAHDLGPAPIAAQTASPVPQAPTPSAQTRGGHLQHVYGTCEDGSCGLRVHADHNTGSTVLGVEQDRDVIYVACQAAGDRVVPNETRDHTASSVWDKLSDGGWVSDVYVDTSGIGTFSAGISQC